MVRISVSRPGITGLIPEIETCTVLFNVSQMQAKVPRYLEKGLSIPSPNSDFVRTRKYCIYIVKQCHGDNAVLSDYRASKSRITQGCVSSVNTPNMAALSKVKFLVNIVCRTDLNGTNKT